MIDFKIQCLIKQGCPDELATEVVMLREENKFKHKFILDDDINYMYPDLILCGLNETEQNLIKNSIKESFETELSYLKNKLGK